MVTLWEIKVKERENGMFRVTVHGPEGARAGDGRTPEAAFAMCVAGFVYKPPFGPNWQYTETGKSVR